jgi:hypothetical protein
LVACTDHTAWPLARSPSCCGSTMNVRYSEKFIGRQVDRISQISSAHHSRSSVSRSSTIHPASTRFSVRTSFLCSVVIAKLGRSTPLLYAVWRLLRMAGIGHFQPLSIHLANGCFRGRSSHSASVTAEST